jgi:hypothetical protein
MQSPRAAAARKLAALCKFSDAAHTYIAMKSKSFYCFNIIIAKTLFICFMKYFIE